MNFNINDGKWIGKMLDRYENSSKVFALVWATWFLGFMVALTLFINAIKWW